MGFSRKRYRITPTPTNYRMLNWGSYYCETSPGNWKKYASYNSPDGWNYAKQEVVMDSLHGKPPWRSGGPFLSVKIENPLASASLFGGGTYYTNFQYSTSVGYGYVKYSGLAAGAPISIPQGLDTLSAGAAWMAGDASVIPSTASLNSRVWDQTKPKIEQGGLFVAIAEIRDVPHMLHTTAEGFHDIWKAMGGSGVGHIMKPKNVANHFLNHTFGWVPFLKDVNDLIDNIKNAHDRIERLKRDNGQWVKRRAILVNQNDDVLLGKTNGVNIITPATGDFFAIDGNGQYVSPYYETRRQTFTLASTSGRFRYYLPEFDADRPDQMGLLGDIKRRLDIHGARINPSNVYKAIPWTWLIDWVSDVGKTIQAVQDQTMDNMAAKYLYLMHHQIKTIRMRQFMPFNAKSGGEQVFEYDQIIDCKQRKEADSPFGFGLSWDNLTPKQLAILAALGITRH